MAQSFEIDPSLQLEAIYYSAPVPRGPAALTVMALVFDRVHFAGVHLPVDNFDLKDWNNEIDRIAALDLRDTDTIELLTVMRFVVHAKTLAGFCIFDRRTGDPLGDDVPQRFVKDIYQQLHGPPREGFIPLFQSWHHKAVPGSDEHITYPGTYYYPATAFLRANDAGFPLINDLPGLPLPGVQPSDFTSHAKSLSAFLAMQTISVVLPELPILHPEELMEFRDQNQQALRAFRRSMLRYAGDWQSKLAEADTGELAQSAKFLIETEIVPALDELRQSMSDPARPWHRRIIDAVRVLPSVAAAAFTMPPEAAVAKVLTSYAPQFFEELTAKGDKHEAVKRSGLYYLLRLQAASKR